MSHFAGWKLEEEGVRVSKIFAFQSPTGGDVHFKKAFDACFSGRTFNTLYGNDTHLIFHRADLHCVPLHVRPPDRCRDFLG